MNVSIERFGERALVLSVTESALLEVQRRLWRVARSVRSWDGVVDAVCGAGNLTLIANSGVADFEPLAARLRDAWDDSVNATFDATARLVEIPVVYGGDDGPDLALVAERAGLSELEVIELHAGAEYVVLFLGFLPGFGYLGGLDSRLRVPRRSVPRVAVPAGAVAIAGEMTGVYSVRSPGGWNVIGRTDVRLFDASREPSTLLELGDRVRFSVVR